jgi:hypothetical protein
VRSLRCNQSCVHLCRQLDRGAWRRLEAHDARNRTRLRILLDTRLLPFRRHLTTSNPPSHLAICGSRSYPTQAAGGKSGEMGPDAEMDRSAKTLGPDTQTSEGDTARQERDITGPYDDNSSPLQSTQIPSPKIRKPLIETIRSCFSAESPLRNDGQPYLSEHAGLWNRPLSEVRLVSGMEDGNTMSEKLLPADLWTKLEYANTKQAIIAVNNIDDEWCKALCTRFSQHINERFLLEHILGLTLPASCTCRDGISPICRAIAADVGRVNQLLSGRLDTPRGDVGFHINYWRESASAVNGPPPMEGCMLRRAFEKIRSYGFISCCQVKAHICKCRY